MGSSFYVRNPVSISETERAHSAASIGAIWTMYMNNTEKRAPSVRQSAFPGQEQVNQSE